MQRAGYIIMCVVMVWVSVLEAARPFATDDAGIVESGGYELELGGDFWEDEAMLGLGFKHGLTDRMDIGVGFGYTIYPEQAEGISEAELGLKFALIPDLFAASFTGGLGTTAYSLNGIITYAFNSIEIDGNLGYEAIPIQGQEGTVFYCLAVILGMDKFVIGAEASGNKDGLDTWLAGGRYQIVDGFAVDLGFSGGFEQGAGNILTAGFHYEF
jgi:hypothetical protein